jgi:choice-of-anchor A domain-containing protein
MPHQFLTHHSTRSRIAVVALTALASVSIVSSAQAGTLSGAAQNYNLFLFDDWNQRGGDVEGRVAIGGNATLQNVGIADRLSNSNGTDDRLIVGGNLSYNGGQVFGGNSIVGGTSSSVNYNCSACLTKSGTPINFENARSFYRDLSDTLFALEGTGTQSLNPYSKQLQLNGAGTGTHVFNISLADVKEIFLGASSESDLVVINVLDEAIDSQITSFFHAEANADSNKWSNVIWNFNQAKNLNIQNASWRGTLLAPEAHLTLQAGNIEGQTIAKSATLNNWSGEFHNYEFDGKLPVSATPEPETTIPEPSLLLGMGAIAGAMKISRRRRTVAV